MAERVVVADDAADVRTVVRAHLEADGFEVVEAVDGRAALAAVREHGPSLVLLDVVLPGVDGLEVLAALRRESDVPVILMSGRGLVRDRVEGLDMGADDNLVKPLDVLEVAARVRAVLRRRGASTPAELAVGKLRIDLHRRETRLGEEVVPLSPKEYDLLVHLATFPGKVHSRDQLLRQVWRSAPGLQDPTTVTEHVRRLRHKLEDDPARPRLIRTVRGWGYLLEHEQVAAAG